MGTEHESSSPAERVTERDVIDAERRAAEARVRAARAGLSAAESFDRSAQRHEEVARIQEEAVQRGTPGASVHHGSSVRHREAAGDDRRLAKLKRDESETDLSGAPEE